MTKRKRTPATPTKARATKPRAERTGGRTAPRAQKKTTPKKAPKKTPTTTATNPSQPSSPRAPRPRGKRATPVTRRRSTSPPTNRAHKRKGSPPSPAAGTFPRPPSGSSAKRAPKAGTQGTQRTKKAATARKPAPAKRPAKKPAIRRPRPAPKKRPLSRSKAAIAARKRRADERAIEEQKKATRREKDRARRAKKAGKIDEREQAIGWLEQIRNDFASVVATSLQITEPEVSAKTPWLVVGRFDFLEDLDYETLATALQVVADDVLLEAAIHPQRLSQIRIVYADPNAKRGEGDSIVSKIGAWEYIVADLIGEIMGGGYDSEGDIDEGALAGRYADTLIPTLYVYFSAEIQSYRTVSPGQMTQTIKLDKKKG